MKSRLVGGAWSFRKCDFEDHSGWAVVLVHTQPHSVALEHRMRNSHSVLLIRSKRCLGLILLSLQHQPLANIPFNKEKADGRMSTFDNGIQLALNNIILISLCLFSWPPYIYNKQHRFLFQGLTQSVFLKQIYLSKSELSLNAI